jgi:hypothetical protein
VVQFHRYRSQFFILIIIVVVVVMVFENINDNGDAFNSTQIKSLCCLRASEKERNGSNGKGSAVMEEESCKEQ